MPLFEVTVTKETTIVVEAENEDHAYKVARFGADEALSEDWNSTPIARVMGEITILDQLKDGWDGDCLPYGGDGSTRIKDILK